MIKQLWIRNFKSAKDLQINCKRVNIFIGEPNTGKSNILESLGLLSFGYYGGTGKLEEFVRHEEIVDLFSDRDIDESVEISFDDEKVKIHFEDLQFKFVYSGKEEPKVFFVYNSTRTSLKEFERFKFYRFKTLRESERSELGFLLPPSGCNLHTLLLAHRELRSTAQNILENFGLKLVLEPPQNKVKVLKLSDELIVLFPYAVISDTIQRVIFNLVAVRSNNNSVITLEEPEAHAFPFYAKFLAESIAIDERNNQYFIATHNPYFLLPIMEKTSKGDLAVFLTYLKDYQTKVKLLGDRELEEVLDRGIDVFFNVERFLEEEE